MKQGDWIINSTTKTKICPEQEKIRILETIMRLINTTVGIRNMALELKKRFGRESCNIEIKITEGL